MTRARQHVAQGRRAPVSSLEQRRLLNAFIGAAERGDVAELEGLFASDIVSTSDGGGFVRAARIPVVGSERVAKFIAAVAAPFWRGVKLTWVQANGQACVLMSRDGTVVALVTIEASAEGIDRIMWMMRPSKLAAISVASERAPRVTP